MGDDVITRNQNYAGYRDVEIKLEPRMFVQLPENLLRLVKVAENKHPAPFPYCFKSIYSSEQDAELQSAHLFITNYDIFVLHLALSTLFLHDTICHKNPFQ